MPAGLPGPLGPIGNVASGKLFDDKIALDTRYQYNGSKESGAAWRERVRGYLISKSPILHQMLPWAEGHDQMVITTAMTTAAVAGRTTPGDLTLLSIAVWGFLGTCCTSTAETIHGSGEKLNGFETWRRLCRHIDMGASLHLEELRSAVRHVVLKPIRRLEDVAIGVIEFEQTFRRYREAGGTMPPESELKSDLLAILPGEIREHLLIRSTDSGVSFLQFKDFVVSQTSRILVARRKSPMVGSLDVDFVSAYDAEGHAEQNQ